MAILWEAEQPVQEAHSPSRPQRVQRADAGRTGECRRISGDCSERDPDSHLKFTGSEALPEYASKAGVILKGMPAIQRTV